MISLLGIWGQEVPSAILALLSAVAHGYKSLSAEAWLGKGSLPDIGSWRQWPQLGMGKGNS